MKYLNLLSKMPNWKTYFAISTEGSSEYSMVETKACNPTTRDGLCGFSFLKDNLVSLLKHIEFVQSIQLY